MQPDTAASLLSFRRRGNARHAPGRVELLGPRAHGRVALEDFVRARFAEAYGAEVRHFLTQLMALRDGRRGLLAVLGFRFAASERLFLEQYLDQPVECTLPASAGSVSRAGIVEVGNLATGSSGGARWLIAALTAFLKGAGLQWAVFTAVPALCNAFRRMGIELIALAPADAARLAPEERTRWGRYYDTAPVVVAANVHQSFDALTLFLRHTGDRYRLMGLWQRAYAAGIFAEVAQ